MAVWMMAALAVGVATGVLSVECSKADTDPTEWLVAGRAGAGHGHENMKLERRVERRWK